MIQETIRAIRLQKKISQKEMAAHLKLSRFGYAKLENGAQSIRFDQFRAILAKLGYRIVFEPDVPESPKNGSKIDSVKMWGGRDSSNSPFISIPDRHKPKK